MAINPYRAWQSRFSNPDVPLSGTVDLGTLLYPALEQVVRPEVLQAQEFDISPYTSGVNLPQAGPFGYYRFGQDPTGGQQLSGINQILQNLYAADPGSFKSGFDPYASFSDWSTRQNQRPGFNEGLDLGSFISGGIEHIGDTASELASERGAQVLALAAGGGAMMGGGAGAGSAAAGGGYLGGLTPGAGVGLSPTAAGAAGLSPTYATGALAPGYFGAETLALGGAAGAGLGGGATIPISNISDPMADAGVFSGMDSSQLANTGSLTTNSAAASFPYKDVIQTGLGLYELYQADKSQDYYQDILNQLNSENYDYRQNDDLVNSYLRDPMALIRQNPGYQASVDYLTKQGQREMAAKGMMGSGNISYYLADTLGKNANDWYNKMWAPIRDSAGLQRDRGKLDQVGFAAQNATSDAQRRARGEIFNAGARLLPDIFKWTNS